MAVVRYISRCTCCPTRVRSRCRLKTKLKCVRVFQGARTNGHTFNIVRKSTGKRKTLRAKTRIPICSSNDYCKCEHLVFHPAEGKKRIDSTPPPCRYISRTSVYTNHTRPRETVRNDNGNR